MSGLLKRSNCSLCFTGAGLVNCHAMNMSPAGLYWIQFQRFSRVFDDLWQIYMQSGHFVSLLWQYASIQGFCESVCWFSACSLALVSRHLLYVPGTQCDSVKFQFSCIICYFVQPYLALCGLKWGILNISVLLDTRAMLISVVMLGSIEKTSLKAYNGVFNTLSAHIRTLIIALNEENSAVWEFLLNHTH